MAASIYNTSGSYWTISPWQRGYMTYPELLSNNYVQDLVFYTSESYSRYSYIKRSGNTVYWYNTNDVDSQFNSSNKKILLGCIWLIIRKMRCNYIYLQFHCIDRVHLRHYTNIWFCRHLTFCHRGVVVVLVQIRGAVNKRL